MEILEPTGTSPTTGSAATTTPTAGWSTTGGRTLREAQTKAATLTRQLRAGRTRTTCDPRRVDVRAEAARWLDPANHRTRDNRPWSGRHADNVEREWRLRIERELPRRATAADLDDRQLWVRIINRAQASGLSPAAVQKTGQICRSLISWFQDADLLTRNPMRGVRYTTTRGDNVGRGPVAIPPEKIPNLKQHWSRRGPFVLS